MSCINSGGTANNFLFRCNNQTYNCLLSKVLFTLSQNYFLGKMSSRKTVNRRGTTKKRAQRATSNVFAMFDQAQIAEFKEAFNMIDQNHDGFVDKEDLHDMLASLGNILFMILKLGLGVVLSIDIDCSATL